MTIEEYLAPQKEEMPSWLEEFNMGDELNIANIISSSRIVFYPFAGNDGVPISTFNKAQYSHVFLYTDGDVSEESYLNDIKQNGCRGYHILETRKITKDELTPNGWIQHFDASGEPIQISREGLNLSFAMITIFERDEAHDDSRGSKRFALIYLGTDGVTVYDAIFGNKYCESFVPVLRGCNYEQSVTKDLFNHMAKITYTYPEMILLDSMDDVWNGYKKIENVDPAEDRFHVTCGYLFAKLKNFREIVFDYMEQKGINELDARKDSLLPPDVWDSIMDADHPRNPTVEEIIAFIRQLKLDWDEIAELFNNIRGEKVLGFGDDVDGTFTIELLNALNDF